MTQNQGCKSQAWQIGPGRAVFCEDFANIRHFFERTILNFKWVINKVQIFIEKSLKNTYRNKIEHGRPEISAGPGRAVTAEDFSGPGRAGPYSPARPGPAQRFTTLLKTCQEVKFDLLFHIIY